MDHSRLFTALVLASFFGMLAGPRSSAGEKPNIILILVDDMGFSDLGCYGSEIETPHLDRLAADGLRFTQFYNTARCWPTRGAILSGYYPQQIQRDALPGIGGGSQGVRPRWARLLPELLTTANYRSYHSGKWHIDGPVLKSGFLRSLDMRNQGNYFSPAGNLTDDRQPSVPAKEQGYYATTATIDHAIGCLEDHAAQHKDQPFFQYIAFIAPHFPLHALPEDIEKYRDRYLEGWDVLRQSRYEKMRRLGVISTPLSTLESNVGPPYHFPQALEKLGDGEVNRPNPWESLTEEQKQFQAMKMALHAAMIDRVDQEIGRLMDQLKSMGAFDNTLILFASDNGASAEIMVRDGGHDPLAPMGSAASYLCLGPGFSSAANTPFRRHKTWVHEGGISTPLIAHWPAGIRNGGQLRHTPAHVIDIVPTILDLLELDPPSDPVASAAGPPFPGMSLRAALAEDIVIPRKFLWWLHEGNRAVRVGDFKLVAARDQPWELYDLRIDRAESNNLADGNPEKVEELANLWQMQTDSFIELAKENLESRPNPPRPR